MKTQITPSLDQSDLIAFSQVMALKEKVLALCVKHPEKVAVLLSEKIKEPHNE